MAYGIICEYNPFHNGHLHQIKKIREISDETIVCVMSGNFTQRGEAALVDKYKRAEMAVRSGADVVLELPVPYCIASAEYFAQAGVSILASLGVDKLCFGSESADAERILRIARVACSAEFKDMCRELPKDLASTGAYFELLERVSGEGGILSNDILAIEYAKAIIKNGYDMTIYPILREGAAYRDLELGDGCHPSAAAIRANIDAGDLRNIEEHVPSATAEILRSAPLARLENAGDAVLLALRLRYDTESDLAVNDPGLVSRILRLANECTDFEAFEREVQTKKYTSSAIRRAMLYILLGIRNFDLSAPPQYTVLLGASREGRGYLSDMRKNDEEIRIVTKPADAPSGRELVLSTRVDALYSMCLEQKLDSGFSMRKKPYIEI